VAKRTYTKACKYCDCSYQSTNSPRSTVYESCGATVCLQAQSDDFNAARASWQAEADAIRAAQPKTRTQTRVTSGEWGMICMMANPGLAKKGKKA
jgi:hypothetical protein